jgi:hypothetical protein
MRRSRWYYLAVAIGSAAAFLADYPPAREAIRFAVRGYVDDVISQVQYRAAIERTLEQIRHLPESKEAE